MIFFKTRFNSFLRLFFCATLLTSCFEKKEPAAVPATQEDDKVVELIQTEITVLEADKAVMKERIAQTQKSLDENALRPVMQEYTRKEYFQYERMLRQIEQQIDYLKIKKALREKTVHERLKKGLTLQDLDEEKAAFEIDAKANVKNYPWRKLPKLEKPKEAKKEGDHGEESADGHGDSKAEDSKGGHH